MSCGCRKRNADGTQPLHTVRLPGGKEKRYYSEAAAMRELTRVTGATYIPPAS